MTQPMGAECDLDALIEWRMRVLDRATSEALRVIYDALNIPSSIPKLDFLKDLDLRSA